MMATFNSLERERERERVSVRERGFVMTQTLLLAKISVCLAVFVFPNTLPACLPYVAYIYDVHVHACAR